MNFVEAIKAAQKDGQLCIMRNISLTSFRIVQPTNTKWGCLMAEQYGPVQGTTQVIAHYSPTIEDLTSDAWRIAASKQLYYDASFEEQQETMPEKSSQPSIDDAISHLCGCIVENDVSNETLTVLTAGIKTLTDAKNNLLWEKIKLVAAAAAQAAKTGSTNPDYKSEVKESDIDGNEQTPE